MRAESPTPDSRESPDVRLKRLRIRSVRRGMRELDLLFGAFAEGLEALSPAELDAYERLLGENDQDVLAWLTGQAPIPPDHAQILPRLSTAGRKSGLS